MSLTVQRATSPLANSVPAQAAAPATRKWSHALLTFVDQAQVSLASALTTIIVGRACSKEELGIFSVATTLLWRSVGIPTSLLWSPYAARAPHLRSKSLARFAGSTMVLTLLLGLVQSAAAALAFVVCLLLATSTEVNPLVAPMLLGLVPLLAATTLREHVRRICIADFRGPSLIAVDMPICLAQVGALLALWHFDRLTFTTALFSMAGASALSAIWVVREWPKLRIRPAMVKAHFWSNLGFGGWLLAISIAWLVCDLILRTLLGIFHGAESLGEFASANMIVNLMNPLVLAATTFSRTLAARLFAENGDAGLMRFSVRGTTLAATLAILAVAVLGFLGEQIVTLLFQKSYASNWLVGAIAAGFAMQAVAIPVEASLMALERGRQLFVVSMMRVGVTLVAGVPLVAWYGAAGIGLTFALQGAIALGLHWYFFLSRGRT